MGHIAVLPNNHLPVVMFIVAQHIEKQAYMGTCLVKMWACHTMKNLVSDIYVSFCFKYDALMIANPQSLEKLINLD